MTGAPQSNTIAAASGSAQMLNSLIVSRLPNVPPPISEMPAIRSTRSGAARSASAMLVSGPVGTSHVPSVARHVSMMNPTASVLSSGRVGAGRSAPSRPLSPCTNVAASGGAISGRAAPECTGAVEAEQVAHHACVVRGALERSVAGHRGDAHELGCVVGDDDRDDVVVSGIAVEEDSGPGC